MKQLIAGSGSKICWLCGDKDKQLTKHHILPKTLKPKFNMTIPLCIDCHSIIHKAMPIFLE